MDGAPPVRYPVRRLGRLAVAQGLAAALGAGLLAAWWTRAQVPAALGLAAVGLWWALVLGNAWAWWRSPQGTLSWAALQWHWCPLGRAYPFESAQPVRLTVRLDLQNALCLSWQACAAPEALDQVEACAAVRWTDWLGVAGLARLRAAWPTRTCWVWLTRSQDPSSWHALRCALFSPGDSATPQSR